MKKINLLKPDVETGYLSNGKGQEINYMNIRPDLTVAKLEEDIRNGATYLQEVYDISKKKGNRVVAIKCKSREEGLLAVSYLASIFNRAEGIREDEYDKNEDNVSSEQDIDFDDFNSDMPFFEDDRDDDESCEDDWENGDFWEETPWKIPIIQMIDLCSDDEGGNNNPFYNSGMAFGRTANNDTRIPYWRYTRKESICVIYEAYGCYGFSSFSPNVFKRYKNNRHVFVLVVDQNARIDEAKESDIRNPFSDDPEDVYYSSASIYEATLTQFVLEHSADIISIHHGDDDLDRYYQNLFENWVDSYGFALAKGFPTGSISKKIVSMDNANKSDMIGKVISYVIKDIDKPCTLTDEDFNVLYRLKGLGLKHRKEEKEHKSIDKMEKNLIGMETIKEDIRAIVETFKYNRRRKALGLNTGGYHNVHMMLGAPGTAKTTVAQLLGEIMAEEKLLKSNRFISVNGAELKGMYVGHSAPKVRSLFEQNDIIFIDEAYAVAAGLDGQSDSFSQEAIAQLIVELENHGMDRLVIFAGYGGPNVSMEDNRMIDFLNCNPGIRSRINSTLFFDSYSADQMVEIFKGQAKMSQYVVPKASEKIIREFFEKRVKDSDFGNGREARSLLENATVQAAKRLSKIPEKELTRRMLQQLTVEDIRCGIERMRNAKTVQKGAEAKRVLGFGQSS
ncbi:MAG: AAA family ATPase [Lachnospiraceae bacterium]|nr:AAA family ATPase [Lachnospiraceae bacterium]